MNIGQAAKLGGVSAKMVRHYESIGLLSTAKRTASNYRVYSEKDVHILRFIKQARTLGFPIEHIKELLSLWHNQRRSSQRVKELAQKHLRELDTRIRELSEIKATLENLMQHCHGDDRPECPILDGLATKNLRLGRPGTVRVK
ncbi:MAG: Cu(I)-responsive transcriptional regulator [Pseudomonadota bacterium]